MKIRFLLYVSMFCLVFTSLGFAKEPERLGNSSKAVKVIKKVAPVYPAEAKKKKIQGEIVLDVTVDEQGKVIATKIIKSVDPSLGEAAINAIKQWEYAPLIVDGKPKAFIVSVTINFALEKDKEKAEPAK
jgi:protein TonB